MSLDISKEKVNYAISNNNLKIIEKGVIKKKELKRKLQEIINKHNIRTVIFEHTGIYSVVIKKIIEDMDKDVKTLVVDSSYSDKIRKLFYKSKKNDELDSEILLKAINFQEFFNNFNIDDIVIKMIELVRQHKVLSKSLATIKRLIKSDEGFFNNKFLVQIEKFLEKKKKELEKEMEMTIKNSKYKEIIKKVDGINYISFSYFLAYVKDIKRFPNKWKFLSWCGVVPIQYSSGSFNVSRTTSKVNKEVKGILYMSAISLLRKEEYRQIYESKIKEGKHHFVAITHIMKRIAKKLYTEWKKI